MADLTGTYRVNMTAHTSATVLVDVDEGKLADYARRLGKPVDELELEEIEEFIEDDGFQESPMLCHMCTGSSDRGFYLSMDEWEPDESMDAVVEKDN